MSELLNRMEEEESSSSFILKSIQQKRIQNIEINVVEVITPYK